MPPCHHPLAPITISHPLMGFQEEEGKTEKALGPLVGMGIEVPKLHLLLIDQ